MDGLAARIHDSGNDLARSAQTPNTGRNSLNPLGLLEEAAPENPKKKGLTRYWGLSTITVTQGQEIEEDRKGLKAADQHHKER
jgi:hypothetical protein